jgi:hypothetical protein
MGEVSECCQEPNKSLRFSRFFQQVGCFGYEG